MNILIIDDERTVLKTVYSQLQEMNLGTERIDMADSAADARELMCQFYYDIFLCDIVMPEEDGISFAKWLLEHYSDMKIIFLTAYADVNYMKEAISMHSFDYVLQPVRTEELKQVVERAIAQLKIERKNREMMNRGAFFKNHEDNILEMGALQHLDGKNKDNSYICRLISASSRNKEGESFYLPVLVQILKTEKQLEQIERPVLRLIYQNILEEVFREMQVFNIVLLEEDERDFVILFYWKKIFHYTKDSFYDCLEKFRTLSLRVLQTEIAIYCGEICEPVKLQNCMYPVRQARKDNVRCESRVIFVNNEDKMIGYQSFRLQLGTWQKLLEQEEFVSFKESILSYINRDNRGGMNASTMMKLHENITQMILLYLVNNHIASDVIFDRELPYLSYMGSWQNVEDFGKALTHIVNRLQELKGEKEAKDVIQESIGYIRKHLDTDISVSEIAEYVGMNPEYLTKLFKKSTGHTLKEYVINEKMESAKMLLATTTLPVTLISSHVGYGNYSNFTRSFKQLVGCTPMEYRRISSNQKMQ